MTWPFMNLLRKRFVCLRVCFSITRFLMAGHQNRGWFFMPGWFLVCLILRDIWPRSKCDFCVSKHPMDIRLRIQGRACSWVCHFGCILSVVFSWHFRVLRKCVKWWFCVCGGVIFSFAWFLVASQKSWRCVFLLARCARLSFLSLHAPLIALRSRMRGITILFPYRAWKG